MKIRPSADSTLLVVIPSASPISSFEEPSARVARSGLRGRQVDRLASQPSPVEGEAAGGRLAHRAQELRGRGALADEPGRAKTDGGVEVLRIVIGGQDDDGGPSRELAHDGEPVLVAETDVEQDDVGRGLRTKNARAPSRSAATPTTARSGSRARMRSGPLAEDRVVVDDDDADGRADPRPWCRPERFGHPVADDHSSTTMCRALAAAHVQGRPDLLGALAIPSMPRRMPSRRREGRERSSPRPSPASSIVSRRSSDADRQRIRIGGLPWRTALLTASWAIAERGQLDLARARVHPPPTRQPRPCLSGAARARPATRVPGLCPDHRGPAAGGRRTSREVRRRHPGRGARPRHRRAPRGSGPG